MKIQEETTYLGISCLTLRPNTERPTTIEQGTNRLCEPENLQENVDKVLSEPPQVTKVLGLWDGKTAERVVNSIKLFFEK